MTVPGATTPGQQTRSGTRIASSNMLGRYPFLPSVSQAALPLCQSPCWPIIYPWSLVKITTVRSPSPHSSSFASNRPRLRSTELTLA